MDGLLARRPWAARWTRNYWIVSVLTCGCLPVWIYGVLSTTRPAFKEHFERADGRA